MNFLDHTLRTCRLALVLALGWVVAACGGGGGGGITPGNGAASSPLAPGIYIGSITASGAASSNEWLTVLQADNRWYGWEFISGGAGVDLASGSLTQSGSAGSISVMKAYKSGVVRTGSATLSSVSSQGYVATVDLNPITGWPALRQVSQTSFPVPSISGDLALLQGTWQGTWRDGPTASVIATFTFDPDGKIHFSAVNCREKPLPPTHAIATTGFSGFNIQLSFDDATLCSRTGANMQGVAILRDSRVSGKTQRLDLMAALPDGSGISFHADR